MENWTNNMKHFLIITNAFKDKNLKLTNEIKGYIEKKGGSCQCFTSTGDDAKHAAPEADAIAQETECVLVLGGDGTLIRAASKLVEQNMALIGVNLGTLGYLCELEESNVFAAVDELMEEHYTVEKRMMLCGYGIKQSEKTERKVALNDIVIHRTGALSVVNLIVFVNGEYLNTFRADGIIISTPTGSTGYSLSAGGPVVSPSASMMIMTPIAPHTMNTRSIILSGEEAVTVEIGEGRHNTIEKAVASFDGDTQISMVTGDRIVIRKATVRTKILKLNHLSFVEVLRQKMSNS